MSRWISTFCLVLLLGTCAIAKEKKKQPVPDNVLRAETVLVVIHPDAGEPVSDPRANRTAHDDVEQAMMTWGRFRVVRDTETADLIIGRRLVGRVIVSLLSLHLSPAHLLRDQPGPHRV